MMRVENIHMRERCVKAMIKSLVSFLEFIEPSIRFPRAHNTSPCNIVNHFAQDLCNICFSCIPHNYSLQWPVNMMDNELKEKFELLVIAHHWHGHSILTKFVECS